MRVALLTSDSREVYKDYAHPTPYFGTAPEALIQGFTEIENVQVHVFSCLQTPAASPEKIAENIWYRALHVPKFGWMRTGYQGCIRAIRKAVRQWRPDIVHAQGTERDCAISGIMCGYPNVLTIHGNHRLIARVTGAKPFTYAWLAARLERFVLPRTDGIVCITSYTEEAVRGLARKTWVVPNAVHKSFFAIKRHAAVTPVILFVGHVCLRKNQNHFIKALDPLAAKHKFTVRFFGAVQGDDYGHEFLELVRGRHWCDFQGFADRARLQQELSTAALLVLPSLEDNCPMVVLEAMASGVPVVGSRVGGIPDLISDQETGLFCDPADLADIRSKVDRMLGNPEAARAIANRARDFAQARFNPKSIALRHVEIYRELLARVS